MSLAAVTPIRPKSEPQAWLSPEQVCEIVPGMTVRHLQDLRSKRQGPRYFKPTNKTVLYAEADIHAWVAASVQNTRGQA